MGAVVGTGTYAEGLIGLIVGPLIFAVVVAVLRSQRFDRAYMNRRVIWFAAIAAIVSVPVGLTIFI